MSSPSTSLGSYLQVYKIHMHKIEPLRWLIIMAKPYIYKLRSLTYLYLSKATPTHRKAEPLRWLMLRTRIWFWTLNGWKNFVTSRCVCAYVCMCVHVCASVCMCMLNYDLEGVFNRGPSSTGNDEMFSIQNPPEECSSKVFPGNDNTVPPRLPALLQIWAT